MAVFGQHASLHRVSSCSPEVPDIRSVTQGTSDAEENETVLLQGVPRV